MTILPKISIVTPSYNQGKFLEKTILSVLEQGYPNLEYIIIDGGSTNNSIDIIRKYEKSLAYWVSEADRGQSHAINKGFERATGDVYGWLNSDDWYTPGALAAVAEAFSANPDAGAVVGAGDMVDETGAVIVDLAPFDVTVASLYHWLDRYFWQPSCFFSREAWEDCGPLDEEVHFAMDLDLWLKIAKKFSFATVDSRLSTSLKHADAKTTAQSLMSVMDAALIIARHGGEAVARQHLKEYGKYLADREQGLLWQLQNDARVIEDSNAQILWLQGEIQRIYDSISWKVTAPIRAIKDKLGK